MAIEDRTERVKQALTKIEVYNKLVIQDGFAPPTIGEMKDRTKDLCDEAKDELDHIKAEADQWI